MKELTKIWISLSEKTAVDRNIIACDITGDKYLSTCVNTEESKEDITPVLAFNNIERKKIYFVSYH